MRPTVRSLLLGFGSTTASKQRGPAGNERPGHSAFGSRSLDSAADDVLLSLALLAIFSEAYDESFARALLDPAYGKELLKGKAYKEWKAVDAAKNSPVLVEHFYRRTSSRAELKHAKDKLAPGLADIENVRPFAKPPRNWLMEVGKAAGLQCGLGTAYLRRSHAIKERLNGKMSVPEMVKGPLPSRRPSSPPSRRLYGGNGPRDPRQDGQRRRPQRARQRRAARRPCRPRPSDSGRRGRGHPQQSGREGGRAIGGKYCRPASRRRSVLAIKTFCRQTQPLAVDGQDELDVEGREFAAQMRGPAEGHVPLSYEGILRVFRTLQSWLLQKDLPRPSRDTIGQTIDLVRHNAMTRK